jgi:murein DD-endopeptidase MepM/ murein hydrolase activator NlpD
MTPKASVFAVLDGEIIEATKKASEGNYVLIKHSNVGGKAGNEGVFYSCYLHLDSLSVTKGDRVQEGMEIGKSGNTGMSTGEHLHFQIDTWDAPFHPYWPFNTQDAKAL